MFLRSSNILGTNQDFGGNNIMIKEAPTPCDGVTDYILATSADGLDTVYMNKQNLPKRPPYILS